MKTPIIWHKLLLEKKKIVVSKEIHDLAKKLEKNERGSLNYLQRHGYIVRVLRGFYYLKTPEERELGKLNNSIYEIVAMALKKKGIKNWYFGLETALKFNNMTHEYYSVNYVITNSYETTKIINIMDTKFKFLKWNEKHFQFGLKHKNNISYSDKEKTILDMAYRTYRHKSKGMYAIDQVQEYSSLLNYDVLGEYLQHYPKRFQKYGEIL